jgi:hypothetical protein
MGSVTLYARGRARVKSGRAEIAFCVAKPSRCHGVRLIRTPVGPALVQQISKSDWQAIVAVPHGLIFILANIDVKADDVVMALRPLPATATTAIR